MEEWIGSTDCGAAASLIFVPAQAARKIPTEMTRSVFAVFIRLEDKIGCF